MNRILLVFGGARLSRKGERIFIENSHRSGSLPVRYVQGVISVGSVSLTHGAVNLLLKNSVPLFFITNYGSLKGVLSVPTLNSREKKRLNQYGAFLSKGDRIATQIVRQKLTKIRELFSINTEAFERELEKAQSLDTLMGIEGNASRLMFERFREDISGSGLAFGGRSYRPPKDPVNALLSLAYTFSHSLVFALTLMQGYDPYLSFLHSKRGSHPAFCSDVIEPVRPLITKLLEKPINLGVFKKEDFKREGKGVYLKRESHTKFLRWFESVKEPLLSAIRESLENIGRAME